MPKVFPGTNIEFDPVTPVEPQMGFYDYSKELKDRIAKCAYQIFESRGRTHGYDVADWLQAESQVLKPVSIAVHEAEHLYTVTMDACGFTAAELEVRVEPFRIFIIGKQRESLAGLTAGTAAAGGHEEEIFQAVDLGSEIDTTTVIAELSNGDLTISMRKLGAREDAAVPHRKSSNLPTTAAQMRKRADIAKRYADAAKNQAQRATSKEKKARAHAISKQKDVAGRSRPKLPRVEMPWTEEVPHSSLG